MSKILVAVTVLLAAHSLNAADAENALKHAKQYGAEACIILRCIDHDGNIVTNAAVSTALYPDGSFETAIVKNGTVDDNGCFVMKGKTNGEFSFTINKDGYYKTREVKHLFHNPAVSVSAKRWHPYGATNTVVLKRVMSPVAMYAADRASNYTLIPIVGEPLGFDLTAGDWIYPHGTGKTRDFDVTYIRDGEGVAFTNQELILSVLTPFAGFKKVPCDIYSAFKSPYQADTNAVYEQEMRFSFKRPGGTGRYIDGQMKDDECIVLRTRPRVDKDGRLIGAYYGKIYGPLRFGVSYDAPGSMKILHYFNPNENDPNLEADTTQNLLPPHQLNFSP